MSLRYLLDTSIVSSPVTKSPNRRILERLDLEGPRCAVAAPVWHELVYGCLRLPQSSRRSAIEGYLYDVVRRVFPILDYDAAAAHWHAAERARLEALGKTAPYSDGQIAAVAHLHGLVVVTQNEKDFRRFRGITVENWAKP